MDTIIVLDCGGQYAHLIANRIRRLQVFSEIKQNDTKASEMAYAKGIIISGGPQSVYDEDSPQIDPLIFSLGIPVLGICYGHHQVGHNLKGRITPCRVKEYGPTEIERVKECPKIFEGLGEKEIMWMSHGDEITDLPEGFETIYKTKDCENAAIANTEKNIYGIQFHAEVTHSKNGMKIFENFLDICQAKKEWTIDKFLKEESQRIKDHIGDKNVFLLTSGGVDSTVAFLILSKVLGNEKVYGLFVDTGLMRKDERDEVEDSMRSLGFTNFHVAEKKEAYLEALKETYEPEQKRKIIGDLFLDIQREYVQKLNLNPEDWILGQGTIYPDTIESGGTKHASKIKTHHNRVPQIEELIEKGLIIEPIADLYKDEVRELGITLGLREELVWRHPFPGPGLGVRILCAPEEDQVPNPEEVQDKIQEICGMENRVLPIKSVGVQGDARTYRHPVCLFPGESDFTWEELEKYSTEITNKVPEVNRVIFCLSHKTPPENIQLIPSYITENRVSVLQEIDAITMGIVRKSGLMRDIWQFPVVLLPASTDGEKESIVLRPVCSEEAMTANFTKIDKEVLQEINEKCMETNDISMLFFDLTNKPPGTIEWE